MAANILVIEDHPTNLNLMKYLLTAFGHTTLTAMDGEAGIDLARSGKPDLVICDIQLPVKDGYQVAAEMKADPVLKNIPLVAVTAYAMVGDKDKLLASGFDGYMSKPIDPETFIQHVEEHLPRPGVPSRAAVSDESTPWQAPNSRFMGKVLVVDDNQVNLELMRTILEPAGYGVAVASNIDSAIAMARRDKPDLIITDVHIAEESGYVLTSLLKQVEELKDIPCLIITSTCVSSDSAERAEAVGAKLFVIRPVEPETLLGDIEECILSSKR